MTLDEAKTRKPCFIELDFDYTLEQPNYRGINVTFAVSEELSTRSLSWYTHIFMTKAGVRSNDHIHPTHWLYSVYDLISWHKGPVVEEGTSLLGEKKDAEATPTPV